MSSPTPHDFPSSRSPPAGLADWSCRSSSPSSCFVRCNRLPGQGYIYRYKKRDSYLIFRDTICQTTVCHNKSCEKLLTDHVIVLMTCGSDHLSQMIRIVADTLQQALDRPVSSRQSLNHLTVYRKLSTTIYSVLEAEALPRLTQRIVRPLSDI